jgi:hypothetical protein
MSIHEAVDYFRTFYPEVESIRIEHNLISLSTGGQHEGVIVYFNGLPVLNGSSLLEVSDLARREPEIVTANFENGGIKL